MTKPSSSEELSPRRGCEGRLPGLLLDASCATASLLLLAFRGRFPKELSDWVLADPVTGEGDATRLSFGDGGGDEKTAMASSLAVPRARGRGGMTSPE